MATVTLKKKTRIQELRKPLLDLDNEAAISAPVPVHVQAIHSFEASQLLDTKAEETSSFHIESSAVEKSSAAQPTTDVSSKTIQIGFKNPNASSSISSTAASTVSPPSASATAAAQTSLLSSLLYQPNPITPLYPKMVAPSAPDLLQLETPYAALVPTASITSSYAASINSNVTMQQQLLQQELRLQAEQQQLQIQQQVHSSVEEFTISGISGVLAECFKVSYPLADQYGLLGPNQDKPVTIAFLERSTPIPPPKELRAFQWIDLSNFQTYPLNIFSKDYARQCDLLQRSILSLTSSDRAALFFSAQGRPLREQVAKELNSKGLEVTWGCFYQVPGYPWMEGSVPLYRGGTHVVYCAHIQYKGVTFDLPVVDDHASDCILV